MSRTNTASRGRWTPVAVAPIGIVDTPNTRMKYVGCDALRVTRSAVQDPLDGAVDWLVVTSVQVETLNRWAVVSYWYWPVSILSIWLVLNLVDRWEFWVVVVLATATA